jgi:hypothetical protein
MFNELCRVACGEDLMDSEKLIGVDLSDLAAYYDMAYMGEHGSWFWLVDEENVKEETGGQKTDAPDRGGACGKWVWIPADDGLRQGAPLSCVLAALTGVKCVRAARDAMDAYHCLADSREPSDMVTDPKTREEVYARAKASAPPTGNRLWSLV